jgi:hypothetical protein
MLNRFSLNTFNFSENGIHFVEKRIIILFFLLVLLEALWRQGRTLSLSLFSEGGRCPMRGK